MTGTRSTATDTGTRHRRLQEKSYLSFDGIWVGTEDFHHRAVLGKFLECLGNVFRFGMSGKIDVEDVFPVLALGGAGFDLREVDL